MKKQAVSIFISVMVLMSSSGIASERNGSTPQQILSHLCDLSIVDQQKFNMEADTEKYPSYQQIFNTQDITIHIISQLDHSDQLLVLKNLCSTNKKLHESYWENADFWNKITHHPEYINWEQVDKFKNESVFDKFANNCKLYFDKAGNDCKSFFHSIFSLPPPEIVTPKETPNLTPNRLLFAIEKDISDLMEISLRIVDESGRRKGHRRISGRMNHPYEIEIITPLTPVDIYDRLYRIRQFESKFSYKGPFDSESVFSLPIRYKLWVSDWALLTYLWDATFNNEEYPTENPDDKAHKYVAIIFGTILNDKDIKIHGIDIFKQYLFTMLTHDFFFQHPPASLLFALTIDKNYVLYLINSTSSQHIIEMTYKKLKETIHKNKYYLKKYYPIDMNSLYKKRRECMQRALDSKETPDAWHLYQEHLKHEDSDFTKEIIGLKKTDVEVREETL